MDEYEEPIIGYMSLGSSQEEPADYVLWNMSGPEAWGELGALMTEDPAYVYQILVKEVRIENSNF